MNYGDKLWERALIGGIGIVQENEPGVPAPLMMNAGKPSSSGRLTPMLTGCPSRLPPVVPRVRRERALRRPPSHRAYFGGLLSGGGDAGGVELMAPFGLLESDEDGGMVVVVPGEVD